VLLRCAIQLSICGQHGEVTVALRRNCSKKFVLSMVIFY